MGCAQSNYTRQKTNSIHPRKVKKTDEPFPLKKDKANKPKLSAPPSFSHTQDIYGQDMTSSTTLGQTEQIKYTPKEDHKINKKELVLRENSKRNLSKRKNLEKKNRRKNLKKRMRQSRKKRSSLSNNEINDEKSLDWINLDDSSDSEEDFENKGKKWIVYEKPQQDRKKKINQQINRSPEIFRKGRIDDLKSRNFGVVLACAYQENQPFRKKQHSSNHYLGC